MSFAITVTLYEPTIGLAHVITPAVVATMPLGAPEIVNVTGLVAVADAVNVKGVDGLPCTVAAGTEGARGTDIATV